MYQQLAVAIIYFYYPGINQPGLTLPGPTTEQIQLIQKLGDEKFIIREEAQKKLEKMDNYAYKALFEGANKDPNPEIRLRCQEILPKIMGYNIPKNLPTLFGTYGLKITFSSGRSFSINQEIFLKYYLKAILESNDSFKDKIEQNLQYMIYLLPMASHHLFKDMRMYGYSRQDINELINAMNKNFKKMSDKRNYDYYYWIKN